MNLLKRVLPFLLTLIIGITLARAPSWLLSEIDTCTPCGAPVAVRYSEPDFNSLTSATILSKPAAHYTLAAQNHKVSGIVQLRAVFSSDKRVLGIKPLTTLPYGLTEEAIKAAYRVEFIPATINDEPVNAEVLLEYNFDLH